MKTEIMQIKDIRPAPYNPREKLKPGDAEWEALDKSIERFDLVVPLIVNKTTGFLISGHQRLEVLKARGETEAEVVIVEMSSDDEKLLNIALNKIEGDWDEEKLKELFEDFDLEDIEVTGFSQEELDTLFELADTENAKDGEPEPEDESGDIEKALDDEIPFSIFLSFPTKEAAEAWLNERGVEETYEGATRNITIKMEGIEYGKRS